MYLGDLEIEECFLVVLCWNVFVMVVCVNCVYGEFGGYVVSYVFVVDLFEVGFNYFFCGVYVVGGGDLVFF